LLKKDLKDFDITETQLDLPTFSVGGGKFYLYREKIVGESNYGCHLFSADSSAVFPGTIHFQFDLVKKLDNRIVKTSTCDYVLYNTPLGYGTSRWIAQRTIQDHIIKVKVWIDKSFSDFVEKPDTFSNFSFKVGDDVVYVLLWNSHVEATTFWRCWRVLSRKLKSR
jgi:hypothetical protein